MNNNILNIFFLVVINKHKNQKGFEDLKNKRIDCSVSNASNEIMLHRISEGKGIEFPFRSLRKE